MSNARNRVQYQAGQAHHAEILAILERHDWRAPLAKLPAAKVIRAAAAAQFMRCGYSSLMCPMPTQTDTVIHVRRRSQEGRVSATPKSIMYTAARTLQFQSPPHERPGEPDVLLLRRYRDGDEPTNLGRFPTAGELEHRGDPVVPWTVPVLYFVGAAAANRFGPLLRFAYGAEYTVARLADRLAKL